MKYNEIPLTIATFEYLEHLYLKIKDLETLLELGNKVKDEYKAIHSIIPLPNHGSLYGRVLELEQNVDFLKRNFYGLLSQIRFFHGMDNKYKLGSTILFKEDMVHILVGDSGIFDYILDLIPEVYYNDSTSVLIFDIKFLEDKTIFNKLISYNLSYSELEE